MPSTATVYDDEMARQTITPALNSTSALGRIMVIDADSKMRKMIAALLMLFGCNVETVADEGSAWHTIRTCAPNLIVLNGQCPGLNSEAICASLKRSPTTWHIPIITLTAGGVPAPDANGNENEADVYIHKPVDLRELEVCVRLLLRRRRQNNHLEHAEDVIFALARAVEAKDAYTEGHLQRMARYTNAIGVRLGLHSDELTALRYGALLHDVGKIGVDEAIIRKAGPLTRDEYRAMQQHTTIGERIVQPLRLAKDTAPIVRHHHERWDGHGYPDGLAEEVIPLSARIVAAADAFDAMTTQRPYNKVISVDEAIERLWAGVGVHWDARIVTVFIEWLRSMNSRSRAEIPSMGV